MNKADILIRGGQVHTGEEDCVLRRADVALRGGLVAHIGENLAADAETVLEAEGCVVAPGFLDLHAHSDRYVTDFTGAESKVTDGVTTEMNGNCGLSPFPSAEEIGAAGAMSASGAPVKSWRDAVSFLDAADKAGSAINRAYLVGHGALRSMVVGFEDRPWNRDEREEMLRRLDQAMEQGALGMSTGLSYAPGCFAGHEELADLARVVAKREGIYATHIRNEGDQLIEAVQEALVVARESGCRLQIGHLKTLGRSNWGKVEELERVMRQAIAEGVDVAADRYPYLACSTGLRALFPPWLMDGGPAKAVERLRDSACRKRLKAEASTEFGGDHLWESAMVSSVKTKENTCWMGHPLAGLARHRGKDPLDAALDLLAEEETQVGVVIFAMSEANLARIINWPFVMVASDSSARTLGRPKGGGALPHPRSYGTFSRVLGRLVRLQKALPLGKALYKMTLQPAQRMKLRRRGALKVGWHADVTVFEPNRVLDCATFDDPFQASEGIRHVLVNGVPALIDGRLTGSRSGRTLRKGGDAE